MSFRQGSVSVIAFGIYAMLAALFGVYWGTEEKGFSCAAWFALSVFSFLVTGILTAIKRSWRWGILRVNAVIFIGVMVNVVSFLIGQTFHWIAVKKNIKAGDSIVRAIERYRKDHDSLPPSLEALIPNYLHSIPKPMFGVSNFQYELASDEVTRDAWGGYQIFAEVGQSFMNPNYLCYRPSRRYPKGVVCIGDWAKIYGGWDKRDRAGRTAVPKFLRFIPKWFGARYD